MKDIIIMIKQLAAEHQTGADLNEIKWKVNVVLKDLANSAGLDPVTRVRLWGQIHHELTYSLISTTDPRWAQVMRYGMNRAGAYKMNALASQGRKNLLQGMILPGRRG